MGVAGPDIGSPTYSCTTSAAATEPIFVTLAVTFKTTSKSDAAPPGTVSPVSEPEVGTPMIARSE